MTNAMPDNKQIAARIADWAAGRMGFETDPFAGMAEAGLFHVGLTEGGYAAIAAAAQALAARTGLLGLAAAWAGRQVAARFFIGGFGDEAQRAAWLPRLAGGSTLAVAISEPGVGAHPKRLTTRAELDGEGFRLSGEKAWATNGPSADVFVVLAILTEESGRKRYGAFLVPRSTPGLSLKPMPEFHALRPAEHCGLVLDSSPVPRASLLGPSGTAFELMAVPFRDVEDAVGLSVKAGAFEAVLRRLAAHGAEREAALSLGGLAGLAAVLAEGAAGVVAALDADRLGTESARMIGLRLLAAELLARVQTHRATFGPTEDPVLERLTADLAASLSVARGPRQIRQARLGEALARDAAAG